VTWLSDAVLAHLGKVAGGPDLTGTRYELIEPIGQGGMGTVYLAHDRELDRPVALKVLHVVPGEAQAEARLQREARVIARLEHPGIVPVHESGVLPDGRFYYAMKLVRGQRLDEHVHRPGAWSERLPIFQKVCDAVAFAHAQGVLHRDLKPQNIMLGSFGEVLVMDWGLAKGQKEEGGRRKEEPEGSDSSFNLPPSFPKTLHGTVLGTPGYMAPEQARGATDVDERADVYSLGAVLYFLLTGQAPIGLGPPGAFSLTSPRCLDRSIPRPLEAVCLKALAPERSERYATVPELADDVARFLAGRRVRAYPESALDVARRLAGKYRAVLALLLAYILMRLVLLMVARS
jgi:serine/threonine protein kinase